MKKILIVGGANGIGLAVAKVLTQRESTKKVYIVDKAPLKNEYQEPKIENFVFDVTNEDYSIFNQFNDIDGLIITVGFGQLSLFHDVDETMIPLYLSTLWLLSASSNISMKSYVLEMTSIAGLWEVSRALCLLHFWLSMGQLKRR